MEFCGKLRASASLRRLRAVGGFFSGSARGFLGSAAGLLFRLALRFHLSLALSFFGGAAGLFLGLALGFHLGLTLGVFGGLLLHRGGFGLLAGGFLFGGGACGFGLLLLLLHRGLLAGGFLSLGLLLGLHGGGLGGAGVWDGGSGLDGRRSGRGGCHGLRGGGFGHLRGEGLGLDGRGGLGERGWQGRRQRCGWHFRRQHSGSGFRGLRRGRDGWNGGCGSCFGHRRCCGAVRDRNGRIDDSWSKERLRR